MTLPSTTNGGSMSYQMLTDKKQTARKNHICSFWPWDGHRIRKGEQYRSATIKYDDHIYTWKSCQYHQDIADSLGDYWKTEDGGVDEECMREWVQESGIDPLPPHERGDHDPA